MYLGTENNSWLYFTARLYLNQKFRCYIKTKKISPLEKFHDFFDELVLMKFISQQSQFRYCKMRLFFPTMNTITFSNKTLIFYSN
jgi:hypothetical protein